MKYTPINNPTRGAVYCEQAYAQGKMLDHSSWAGVLPRNITPSDIDFFFDAAGWLLLCELSSENSRWWQLSTGQQLAYQNYVRRGQIAAALASHSVPQTEQINTRQDVNGFQVMLWNRGQIVVTDIFGGDRWERFVVKWCESPESLYRWLLENARTMPADKVYAEARESSHRASEPDFPDYSGKNEQSVISFEQQQATKALWDAAYATNGGDSAGVPQ